MTNHFNVLPLSKIHSTRHSLECCFPCANIWWTSNLFCLCVTVEQQRWQTIKSKWRSQNRRIEASLVFRKRRLKAREVTTGTENWKVTVAFSLSCALSHFIPESEKGPRACGLVTLVSGKFARAVWQCRTSHRHWLSLSALHRLSDVDIIMGKIQAAVGIYRASLSS